jgi:hypothetical protein
MEMASPCFSLVSRDGDGDKFGVLPRRVAPWLHFAAERVAGKFTLFMPSRRPRTMPPHDPELLDGEVEAALALFLEESCSRLWLRVPLDGRGAAALLAAGGAAGLVKDLMATDSPVRRTRGTRYTLAEALWLRRPPSSSSVDRFAKIPDLRGRRR